MSLILNSVGYLLRGATVLVELWPPRIFYVRFRDSKFYRVGSSAPRPIPNLEGRILMAETIYAVHMHF
jgi:hypothetical protein